MSIALEPRGKSAAYYDHSDRSSDDDDDSREYESYGTEEEEEDEVVVEDDDAEAMIRQQTIVINQATATMDPMVTITYTASLFLSGALVTYVMLQWTDQVLLLVVGTLEAFAIVVAIYQAILRQSIPGAEDELAKTDEERRRAYFSIGRWISGILFILNFAKTVLLLALVALVINMFGTLFTKSLPAYSAVLILVAVLLVMLIVAFASHPSVGMLSHSTTFLTAKGPIGADD